jgi:hypothetical protein
VEDLRKVFPEDERLREIDRRLSSGSETR